MTTTAIPIHPRGRGRVATAIVAATEGAVVGVFATPTLVDRHEPDVKPVAQLRSLAASLPRSADAAEHWVKTGAGSTGFRYRPHAAQRWQGPIIAVADLPYSADAAEHWLCAP